MHKEFTPDAMQRRALYEQHDDVLARIELLPGERRYIDSRHIKIVAIVV